MGDQKWREIEGLPEHTSETLRALDRVDSFRERWSEYVSSVPEDDFKRRQDRTLRSHAIETGIIERLYDVEWGVTESLIAEGVTLEAAEREGSVSPHTLDTIRAQLDGLDYLVSYTKEERDLSVPFIRDLHKLITRTQETYEAHDSLGNDIERKLDHGEWKTENNHVRRPDGSLLEYTPGILVDSQINQLVSLYRDYSATEHPVALAAWLHHRFICVHPFSDGNGRVARALTLLALLRGKFTPLVVRRDTREEYIQALDVANDGDLGPLIRLFARLEENALRSELEGPSLNIAGGAVEVAQAYVERLQARFAATDAQRRESVEILAQELVDRIHIHLEKTSDQLESTFRKIDSSSRFFSKKSDKKTARYWRNQIVRSAREVDFFANLSEGTWWASLFGSVLGSNFRYVVVVQKVGRGESGVLALTAFGESFEFDSTDESGPKSLPAPLIRLSPSDTVNILHTDSADSTFPEIAAVIDRTLSATVAEFSSGLG